MNDLYEELCNLFIRPARQQYNAYDLGTTSHENSYQVIPFWPVMGGDSIFKLLILGNTNSSAPIMRQSSNLGSNPQLTVQSIYIVLTVRVLKVFTNNNNEGVRFGTLFLQNRMHFANFDFSGSGNSEGEYVSLGFHEKNDVMTLIEYIYDKYGIKKFALWGRSMGAVTALKFAELYFENKEKKYLKNNQNNSWSLYSIVLDSPFASLNRLALEIACKKVNLPSFFLRAGFLIIKNSIEEKAKFKIQDLQVVKHLSKIQLPLMIIASKDDNVITYKHSEEIYQNYPCPQKEMVFVKGNHNEPRQEIEINKIVKFFKKNFENSNKYKSKNYLMNIKEDFIGKFKKQSNTLKNAERGINTAAKQSQHSRTPNHSPFKKSFEHTKLKLFQQNQELSEEKRKSKNKTAIRKKLDLFPFSSSLIREQVIPSSLSANNNQNNQNIVIESHYNVINQKLNNMKKKYSSVNPQTNFEKKKIKTEQGNFMTAVEKPAQSFEQQGSLNVYIKEFNRSQKNIFTFERKQDQQTIDPPKQSFRKVSMMKDFSHTRNPSIIKCTKKPSMVCQKKFDLAIKRESPINEPKHATINLKNPIAKLKESIRQEFKQRN